MPFVLWLLPIQGEQVFYGGDFADAWPWLCIITVPVFVPLGLGLGVVADLSQVLNKKDSAGFVKRALNRTRDAADQGRAKAQHNLGNKYRHGEGVARDYAEAAKWYRKAAEQGLAVAQYNLGLMHASGIGVPRNDIESYVWFLVAAATGTGVPRSLWQKPTSRPSNMPPPRNEPPNSSSKSTPTKRSDRQLMNANVARQAMPNVGVGRLFKQRAAATRRRRLVT